MVCRNTFSAAMVAALVVGLIAGCQMMPSGPSDEEQILKLAQDFVNAGNEGKIDAAMAVFAEDFEMETGEDKEAMRYLLEDAIASGIEFDATDLEVKMAEDGKTAAVEGVSVDYTPYVASVAKRDGKWRIIKVEESY
jgi:hypothetical protein